MGVVVHAVVVFFGLAGKFLHCVFNWQGFALCQPFPFGLLRQDEGDNTSIFLFASNELYNYNLETQIKGQQRIPLN
jgi:hypothetical protein